jgi:hypothetical protein
MAEIRGRASILAAQLFLSTIEKMIFSRRENSYGEGKYTKCTGGETRMKSAQNRIDFQFTL